MLRNVSLSDLNTLLRPVTCMQAASTLRGSATHPRPCLHWFICIACVPSLVPGLPVKLAHDNRPLAFSSDCTFLLFDAHNIATSHFPTYNPHLGHFVHIYLPPTTTITPKLDIKVQVRTRPTPTSTQQLTRTQHGSPRRPQKRPHRPRTRAHGPRLALLQREAKGKKSLPHNPTQIQPATINLIQRRNPQRKKNTTNTLPARLQKTRPPSRHDQPRLGFQRLVQDPEENHRPSW
jgi:hypothetical protein